MITGRTNANVVIKAMQMGAKEYLTKPFELDGVIAAVRRVLRSAHVQTTTEAQVPKADPLERIIGSSKKMVDIFKMIGQVARTPVTVLITGETGTGKELVAEALHNASDRRAGPLIKVNCPALPESLLESELFGHEKGAFTGALNQHKGRFEAANKGTIFLDEIGEMTLGTQSKLLRVLQEREFERVGSTAPVKVDVRVIAATNRDLWQEVQAGRFREDLYFRLNVIAIQMPPLRDRQEDISALVSHFLSKHRYSKAALPARISQEALDMLSAYDWPGNVRQLEHVIERAVVLSRGELIGPEQIQFRYERGRHLFDVEQKVQAGVPLEDLLHEVRREAVRTAMRLARGNHEAAARQLSIALEVLDKYIAEFEWTPVNAREASA
ncbi:MAG: sigma-54-dependent Fis family transcriptional regulator [Ktedonobacterales bacterium]|nr:sigma-54-dependent Fis family transcriptional regulator [Ktedonobacterales bacterium]